jgi:hypothetical protein
MSVARRPSVWLVFCLVLAAWGLFATRGPHAVNPANGQPLPESFKGKVLVVYELIGDVETHWGLRGARIETLGGKAFLTGTVIPTGEGEADWQGGLTIRIVWDAVKTILEFDSEAQYGERMLLEKEQKKET